MALAHRGIAMNKHTPAPWAVRFRTDGSSYISMGDPNRGPHKAADLFLTADGGESDRADARLIAAAPELLRALQAVVNDCHDLDMVPSNERGRTTTAFELAVSAIEKATGEG